MWQAPTLTIAAQAFLLNVLTDQDVASSARVVILVAGAMATAAAVLSLMRLRSREVDYSDAIAYYMTREARLPDPRPDKLPHNPLGRTGVWDKHDERLRKRAEAS